MEKLGASSKMMFKYPPRVLEYLGPRFNFAHYENKIQTQYEKIRTIFEAIFDERQKYPWYILDIGCGLGGMDIMLARHHGVKHIHLMDGDGTGSPKVGFHPDIKPWADVTAAKEFVEANVPGDVKTHCIHAIDGSLYKRTKEENLYYNLIMSLQSWCHHYPYDVYRDLVRSSIVEYGILVVDIRRGTDALERFDRDEFTLVGKIGEEPKCERCVFRNGFHTSELVV